MIGGEDTMPVAIVTTRAKQKRSFMAPISVCVDFQFEGEVQVIGGSRAYGHTLRALQALKADNESPAIA